MDDSFEAFAKALRGKSARQIKELAKSEALELPNFTDRDLLIQALYDARTGQKVSPPAAEPESTVVTSSDESPPAAGEPAPSLTVRAIHPHWRAGRYWTNAKERVEMGEFTADQWAMLAADPHLQVK